MDKMYNTGMFKSILEQELRAKIKEIKLEKDPYANWNLKEQRKIIEGLLIKYNNSVNEQLGLG